MIILFATACYLFDIKYNAHALIRWYILYRILTIIELNLLHTALPINSSESHNIFGWVDTSCIIKRGRGTQRCDDHKEGRRLSVIIKAFDTETEAKFLVVGCEIGHVNHLRGVLREGDHLVDDVQLLVNGL